MQRRRPIRSRRQTPSCQGDRRWTARLSRPPSLFFYCLSSTSQSLVLFNADADAAPTAPPTDPNLPGRPPLDGPAFAAFGGPAEAVAQYKAAASGEARSNLFCVLFDHATAQLQQVRPAKSTNSEHVWLANCISVWRDAVQPVLCAARSRNAAAAAQLHLPKVTAAGHFG